MEYSFLDSNEMVILTDENIKSNDLKKVGNLVLTNKNIIFYTVGAFKGHIKNVCKYPLNNIKFFQDQAQAKVYDKEIGNYGLDIYFINDKQRFTFVNRLTKRRILEWVQAINAAVKGESIPSDSTQYSGIPGVAAIAGTLKNTFGAISDNFKEKSNQAASGKCMNCGAPIHGVKGQIVQCAYCDTKQKI